MIVQTENGNNRNAMNKKEFSDGFKIGYDLGNKFMDSISSPLVSRSLLFFGGLGCAFQSAWCYAHHDAAGTAFWMGVTILVGQLL